MATHSNILAWKTPWTEEPDGFQSTGSRRVGHDWATNAIPHFRDEETNVHPLFHLKIIFLLISSSSQFIVSNFLYQRRQWQPTPVLLPGKSHGWRVGCSPWGRNWATSLSLFTFTHWRRKWQPTPVFSPGESQGRGSLVGCRLWGYTESDTIEAT